MNETRSALEVADDHLAVAAQALTTVAGFGRVRSVVSGPSLVGAAAERVAAAVHILRDQVERLEMVTAGDERLIDDVAAALELLQAEVQRLTVRQDLLAERAIEE